MTLPASGAISFSNINVELCRSSTAQLSLNDSCLRTLFGQASGAVCMNTGHGKTNTSVPGAPTGVSASATSSSAISVSFSAPGCTGHLAIDYYQAVCTSSGSNSATGASSPISVTGLSPSTAYTFKVRAHNSKGYGCYSSSTGTATTQAPTGSVSFTCPGFYSWTVPTGVTSISALVISGGTSGSAGQGAHYGPSYDEYGRLNYCGDYFSAGQGGQGGQASWRNNVTVTPGQTLYIRVADVGQPVGYCYMGDTSYISTQTPYQASYNNYYYNTWRNSIVAAGRYCFYTTTFFPGNPQSLGNVGYLTLGTPSGSSAASLGGPNTVTFRGTWFGSYYGGSGPCASKSSGGGGGGGASLASEGSVYPWNISSGYVRGTGGSSAAGGCPFGSTPTYNSKTGQAGSYAGGAGGNSPGTYSNGTQGYGSGALYGSSASQGSVGGISAGGGGISVQTGGITRSPNDSARGAVRIVYPGNTRSWPNTGVCYGA